MSTYEEMAEAFHDFLDDHQVDNAMLMSLLKSELGLEIYNPDGDPKAWLNSMLRSRSRFGKWYLDRTGKGGGTTIDWMRRTSRGYRIVCDKKFGGKVSFHHHRNLEDMEDAFDVKTSYPGSRVVIVWFRGMTPWFYQFLEMKRRARITDIDSLQEWAEGKRDDIE